MKIIGNPVGTTLPKPDWSQTDPTKGDYIKNKPEIPSKLSQLTNDSGYVAENDIGGTIEITSGEPTKDKTVLTLDPNGGEINIYTAQEIDLMISQLSGGETVIPDYYVTEDELAAKNYLTSIPSEYITESELTSKGYLTQHQDLSAYAKKTDIPSVPTKTSQLTNDSGYLTSVPSEYITETELNAKKYLTAVPSEYITETELNSKGYLTQHQDLSAYAKTSAIPTNVSQLTNDKNYLTAVPGEYVTDSELNAKGYLTAVPSEYVTDSELNNKGYAKQTDLSNLSTKVSGIGGIEITSDTPKNDSTVVTIKPTGDSVNIYTADEVDQRLDQLSEEIVDLEENKANILDVKAWIIQQTPLFAESEEWLTENGDTSKVYILDGQIYAWIYKEATKPPYTNWLPLADITTKMSSDETATVCDGYINGVRLNSSGLMKKAAGYSATGFIPYTYKGASDFIELKGSTTPTGTSTYSQEICFYDSSHNFLGYGGFSGNYDTYMSGASNGTVGITITKDSDGVYTILYEPAKVTNIKNGTIDASKIAFIRICTGDFANAIITVNEEIVGGGSSGGYGWYTTGHTFVPADYEDRIIAIERAIENGDIGGRLAIASIVESTDDGGENIITFSDGRTLTVLNGSKGSKGLNGSNGTNGTVQIDPLFAESVSWLNSNGNTSKLYILPNNCVYAYMNGSWQNTGNSFISTDASCQKYISDRNTYIAPVPSGYCESKNEYQDTGVQIANAVNYEMMNNNFRTLASAYPDYITETLLGKDASGTYDIYKYELELNPAISDGFNSVMHTNKPVFIITSGLHGNEKDAVHEVYHFMKDLCENFIESEHLEYLRTNVKFVIVPIANPWGFVNHTYNNSNDVNLNKNFGHGFSYVASTTGSSQNTGANAYSEAETVLLKGVFDEYKDAVFHLECHGKVAVDNAWNDVIWFSLMKSLASELIELCSNTIIHQIGRRLYKLGFDTGKSEGGHITYYTLNGRPKDYTATEYGMLSCTMEGTGRMGVAGHTTYTKHEQRINCEALENFVLRVLDSLNSRVGI